MNATLSPAELTALAIIKRIKFSKSGKVAIMVHMQIFEFQFRGEQYSGDSKFQTFYHYPENVYEKRLGYLFIVAELGNALPPNHTLLKDLSSILKKEYYSVSIRMAPDEALKEALKKGNQYLERLSKKGNVGWLGKLNVAVFSFVSRKKGSFWEVNLAKTGDQRVFLARGAQVIDIARSIDQRETEPDPLKAFGNIVSGKLENEDTIMTFTKELHESFTREEKKGGKRKKEEPALLDEIISLFPLQENKPLEHLFKKREQLIKDVAGLVVLFRLTPQEDRQIRSSKNVAAEKREREKTSFSFREFLSPLLDSARVLPEYSKKIHALVKERGEKLNASLKKLTHSSPSIGRREFFAIPKLRFPSSSKEEERERVKEGVYKVLSFPHKAKERIHEKSVQRALLLLALLLAVVLAGFLWAREQKMQEIREGENALEEVQERVMEAQNLLFLEREKEADRLFRDAWVSLFQMEGIAQEFPVSSRDTYRELSMTVQKYFTEADNIIQLEELEEVAHIERSMFLPHSLFSFQDSLYVFNPHFHDLLRVHKESGKITFIPLRARPIALFSLNQNVLVMTKPNMLLLLDPETNEIEGRFELFFPSKNANIQQAFLSERNLLLYDSQGEEIWRYARTEQFRWEFRDSFPAPFLQEEEVVLFALGKEEVAVLSGVGPALFGRGDERQGTISLHNLEGEKKEEFSLEFFPPLVSPSRMKFSGEHLLLIEPRQKRAILLSREGDVLAQVQSEAFSNLLEATETERNLYFINGAQILRAPSSHARTPQ